MGLSVSEVAHARGDQCHAILVAAINGILIPQAASWVSNCSNHCLTCHLHGVAHEKGKKARIVN